VEQCKIILSTQNIMNQFYGYESPPPRIRISVGFEIKSKTTLDEANAMQIVYVDTENKNSSADVEFAVLSFAMFVN